jgi:sterol desaturase/sphingolipid hydroxylase (fatty acid hydroxylase superfamily)
LEMNLNTLKDYGESRSKGTETGGSSLVSKPSPIIRGLGINTKARTWLLGKFVLSSWNYWFTFVADSLTALFFLGWEIQFRHSSLAWIGLASVLGFVLWGLSEYAFHRWIYHQPEGIFGDGHRIHHEDPLVLVAMPWFMTTITMVALWYPCAEVLNIPYFSAGLAGWLAGFVWYSLVHHGLHHWDMQNPWARKLRAYHRIHHQLPGRNFGVTLRFWDRVFGTYNKKPQSHAKFSHAGSVKGPGDGLAAGMQITSLGSTD